MSRKTVDVELGEYTYQIRQLPLPEGLKVLEKVTKVLSKALKDNNNLDADNFQIAPLLIGAIGSLDQATIMDLLVTFGSQTRFVVDGVEQSLGRKEHISNHFGARYGLMIAYLVECFKVNFENFSELATLLNLGSVSSLFGNKETPAE